MTKSIDTFMKEVSKKTIAAAIRGDFPLFQIGHALIKDFAFLNGLLLALQQSPRRRLSGPKGVLIRLELPRSTVYKQIHCLGLTPDDFCEYHATTYSLMQKSPAIQDLIRQWTLQLRE